MHRHAQTYSANVFMGNWVEESQLEAERLELYLEKRRRDEKLVENMPSDMYENLLRPVVLNAADEFLRYGQDVQLVCRVPPEVTSGSDGCGSDVTLSYGISAEQLSIGLGSGSAVTASPFTEPCVRNCFKIRGLKRGCENGEILKFGDIFAISPCFSNELFVTADIRRLNTELGMSRHPTLKLTETLNKQCRWTAAYWNTVQQLEAEGLAIPNGFRVILKQTSTNENVAVETDFLQSTLFGDEYEVSAHSYTDFRGRDKNIWQFVTSTCRPEEQPADDGSDTNKDNK